MNIQQVKQRFGIIGNTQSLHRAIETALQIAPTDLSVLIVGESGTGKEVFSQIIHQNSTRKHNQYIAINCGAIPDGTIDSELFGHEKGAFTGAVESRKGYFEVANGGTIFLDEVGELPLSTQVRLLRILEVGEYIKVGSSKTLKTNVRVVAATNVNLQKAIREGKFREDLYYRLNTVPISIPPLRERKDDIHLLFRKFAHDTADKYAIPTLRLDEQAVALLTAYQWPGNVRQLKNIAEQMSILEKDRVATYATLKSYIPQDFDTRLPAIIPKDSEQGNYASEREILFKLLFDMKKDMNDLKKLVHDLMEGNMQVKNISNEEIKQYVDTLHTEIENINIDSAAVEISKPYLNPITDSTIIEDTHEVIEESLSLADKEKELILRALQKHNSKRKLAAEELGISERTLYRKIKEFNIDL